MPASCFALVLLGLLVGVAYVFGLTVAAFILGTIVLVIIILSLD